MNKSSELLRAYLSLSEEILSLDFKVDFDKVEDLIMRREEMLLDMQDFEITEDDKNGIAKKIIDLDKKIISKFNEEKEAIKENIEKIKQEKREQNKRKQAFNTYGEEKNIERNVFFDKLK